MCVLPQMIMYHSYINYVFVCVCALLDALVINSLKPYTSYTVRLAAVNAEGVGEFSDTKTVRTEGIRKCCTH